MSDQMMVLNMMHKATLCTKRHLRVSPRVSIICFGDASVFVVDGLCIVYVDGRHIHID
jgi:hypothetical protein